MKLFAHRGNFEGPSVHENALHHVDKALIAGFDVEIDLRCMVGTINDLYLGHDFYDYPVVPSWLLERSDSLLVHAKDVQALHRALELELHCFWHGEDDFTLTSRGFIVTYPGRHLDTTSRSIVMSRDVQEQRTIFDRGEAYGICSDFIGQLK